MNATVRTGCDPFGPTATFAVRIAKSFGAEVTGVCSTDNTDLVRSIGGGHAPSRGRSRPGQDRDHPVVGGIRR
jgi:NADPH:quinone reductase-like Zn-dependent oxidoreductase